MATQMSLAGETLNTSWLKDETHRDFLVKDAGRQLAFFAPSLRSDGGFDVLGHDGQALPRSPQEIHTTTRMVHSYALGHLMGFEGSPAMIDAGMAFLWDQHRDAKHGGYHWAVGGDAAKQAYGHVFVLLAASSAKMAGHADADRLLEDVWGVLDDHFWEEGPGLFREEFEADWTPLSTYRGFNANMHGVEALLTAYEATGEAVFLERAGRIFDFFIKEIAPNHNWRLPEHYTENWQVDLSYGGNPMFRPQGTTPGHSFEFARLYLQYWDLSGRKDPDAVAAARQLIDRAYEDAVPAAGGVAYTLDYSGEVQIPDRYWWPVTEAISAYAALVKIDGDAESETRYRNLWTAAVNLFVDQDLGGWFPEVDSAGQPVENQFIGKPDIYHSLQADLLPLTPGLSKLHDFCTNFETD